MPKAVTGGLAILIALGVGCAAHRPSAVIPPMRDETQAHLETVLEAAIRSHGFPAAAAAVITSKDIHLAAMGKRRVDRPDPVTVDNRFGLGSNTKAVTATMLGTLVERGLLRWDSTLAGALPDLPIRPEYRAVTLRQMLTHRAGIPPWTSDEAFRRALTFSTADLAAGRLAFATTVLSEPPVWRPSCDASRSSCDAWRWSCDSSRPSRDVRRPSRDAGQDGGDSEWSCDDANCRSSHSRRASHDADRDRGEARQAGGDAGRDSRVANPHGRGSGCDGSEASFRIRNPDLQRIDRPLSWSPPSARARTPSRPQGSRGLESPGMKPAVLPRSFEPGGFP